MPTYLITYHGGPGMPTDPAAAQQMLAAFQAWVDLRDEQGQLVEVLPLGGARLSRW